MGERVSAGAVKYLFVEETEYANGYGVRVFDFEWDEAEAWFGGEDAAKEHLAHSPHDVKFMIESGAAGLRRFRVAPELNDFLSYVAERVSEEIAEEDVIYYGASDWRAFAPERIVTLLRMLADVKVLKPDMIGYPEYAVWFVSVMGDYGFEQREFVDIPA